MRKLLLVTLGALLLSTMMFGSNIYQYRDEHQFMFPDFFYFKMQVFNQTNQDIQFINSDDGGDGAVYTGGKESRGKMLPANSTTYMDIIWQLRTVCDNDSNHSGITLNSWRPINDNAYFLSYNTDRGNKRNHYIQFDNNHIYHYGPLNLKIVANGDTLNVYITKAETSN